MLSLFSTYFERFIQNAVKDIPQKIIDDYKFIENGCN